MRAFISVIRIFVFALFSVFCILVALIGLLFTWRKRTMVFFAKYLWSPIALRIMGGRLITEGVEKIQPGLPYVVMSNHCSYLDIPALFKSIPFYLHFVAKKELRRMPFLGWFMILSDMIFIDRKNTAAAKESLAQAAELIKAGKNVVIFPEGTASKTGNMNAFKKGGFHLAQDAGAHIIPVKITGTYFVWPSAAKLNMRRGKIHVRIGKPIAPEVYNALEMEERIEFIRREIEQL